MSIHLAQQEKSKLNEKAFQRNFKIMDDQILTVETAVLDRLVHKSEIFNLLDSSYPEKAKTK
mgnify:CR=1 FL=1